MEEKNMQIRTAFITGASRGIGRGIALALARNGYNLALTCRRNKEDLDAFAQELHSRYMIDVCTYQCNASSYPEVASTIDAALAHFGKITLLVNNAGISKVGLLTDLSPEEWKELIETNLSSLFYHCKSIIPSMLQKEEGRIINISSMWGSVGASCEVAYSASKGGVNAFTRALAKELAPSNIPVNAIACGVIDTDMNRIFTEEDRQALSEEIPAGRFAEPEEVGEAVLALAQMPAYVTGQIIGMDGGYL
ncbi:MAG: SDR family NAD(P)-dependent oxidoreductase [Lachnospiraceae bacterium]|nr:SDR family NAD(P)-dependent oxidoreductase [Lachnospiraceae bacterium]MEE3432914.1 SDR family NAD(P)-dependent oxidoreductase [Lachnospiraceae bacterium]